MKLKYIVTCESEEAAFRFMAAIYGAENLEGVTIFGDKARKQKESAATSTNCRIAKCLCDKCLVESCEYRVSGEFEKDMADLGE